MPSDARCDAFHRTSVVAPAHDFHAQPRTRFSIQPRCAHDSLCEILTVMLDSVHERTRAYALLSIEPCSVASVVRELRSMEGVVAADAVDGPHNAVAVVQVSQPSELAALLFVKVRRMAGVQRMQFLFPFTDAYLAENSPTEA